MKKINILTLAALLLLPFALYQSHIGYPLVAGLTATVSFVFVFIDNQKITGYFQHITMPLVGAVLAYILEQNFSGFPYASIAVLSAVIGFIIRMVFIKTFAYARFRYFELVTLVVTMTLTAWLLYKNPDKWLILIPLYVIIMFLVMHVHIIVKNAFMLDKGAKGGYNASIGVEAPDFILPDQYGNAVKLSDFRNKRHVLLIFVRGDWCPYCHMIMRTYMRKNHRFKEKDIMLIAIGPDPAGINREMAEKLGLDYLVLSDDKMKVAREYGIRLPDFELLNATSHEEGMPLPASFLVDKTGKVVFTSRTTKVGEFLDPSLIFPVVEELN